MFDVGFSELLLIGVVALIVLGPERLPKVARTLGALLGRLNRYAAQVKQDIDREMQLDELRKVQKDMQEAAQKYEIMAGQRVHDVEETVRAEVAQVDQALQEPHPAETGPVPAVDPANREAAENPITVAAETPPSPSTPKPVETAAPPQTGPGHGPVA